MCHLYSSSFLATVSQVIWYKCRLACQLKSVARMHCLGQISYECQDCRHRFTPSPCSDWLLYFLSFVKIYKMVFNQLMLSTVNHIISDKMMLKTLSYGLPDCNTMYSGRWFKIPPIDVLKMETAVSYEILVTNSQTRTNLNIVRLYIYVATG